MQQFKKWSAIHMSRGLNSCDIQKCWSDIQIQNYIINAEIQYFKKNGKIFSPQNNKQRTIFVT
jgi:hypothetical protein